MKAKHRKPNENLRKWNPMVDDYNDENINRYVDGPGSGLAHQGKTKRNSEPFIVIKNTNGKITQKAIYNLCARHGKVQRIVSNARKSHYFVYFPTIADMEAVFRALKANTDFGFYVTIGQNKSEEKETPKNLKTVTSDENAPELPELNRRTFHTSQKLNPRPHLCQFKQKVVVKHPVRPDPRYVLEHSDAHDLERANLPCPQNISHRNLKYTYNMGRARISIPEGIAEFIEKKVCDSQGIVHESLNCFSNSDDPLANRPKNLGKCCECSNICDTVCGRCGTYICSIDCQRISWATHRYNCRVYCPSTEPDTNIQEPVAEDPPKSPPEKESLQLESTIASVSKFVSLPTKPFIDSIAMPLSGSLVTITSISKANVVFIRPYSHEFNTKFVQFMSELQSLRNLYVKLPSPPRNGELVIGCFKEEFNRALVLGNVLGDDRMRVIFVDHGNIDVVSWRDLYKIPEQYITSTFLANPVVLRDVRDTYPTMELKSFLYSQLEDAVMTVKYDKDKDLIAGRGIYSVELTNSSTGVSLNAQLVEMSIAKEPEDPSSMVLYHNYLQLQPLPCGENIDLYVMDNSLLNSGCLSCTTKEYALEIQKFHRDIQHYADALPQQDFCPRVDELCIAKYSVDGKWYRGRCLELLGDGFPTILFIDYGNVASVSIRDMHPYPVQFTFPIYTGDCEIEGLPEDCSDEVVAKLEELIPIGQVLQCDRVVFNKEGNFHTLSVQSIIGQVNGIINVA